MNSVLIGTPSEQFEPTWYVCRREAKMRLKQQGGRVKQSEKGGGEGSTRGLGAGMKVKGKAGVQIFQKGCLEPRAV